MTKIKHKLIAFISYLNALTLRAECLPKSKLSSQPILVDTITEIDTSLRIIKDCPLGWALPTLQGFVIINIFVPWVQTYQPPPAYI